MFSNNITHTIDLTHISKAIVDDLNNVTQNFLIYLPLIFFIFGFIGFIGNLFTYLQPELRFNTCCIYSLCGSIVDIINLSLNSFPSYLGAKYGTFIPWFTTSILCKVNLFLVVFLPHLSINFLLMAIIDRFACTCSFTSPIRRINQLKMVPWMIITTIIISCLASIYAPILFDLMYGIYCASVQPITTSVLYVSVIGILHPMVMLIFVLLTYRNVRRSRRRVGEGIGTHLNQSRKQFIVMIFSQVIMTSIFTLQWIITYIYYTITSNEMQTFEQLSIIYFVYSLTNNCFYLNNVKSFYLSILTSRLFRTTFIKGLIALLPRHMRVRFQVLHRDISTVRIITIRRGGVPQHEY